MPNLHQACENTDREIWREREGDYYADSIHVTKQGAIGINCGGHVYVKPVREWHKLAGGIEAMLPKPDPAPPSGEPVLKMEAALWELIKLKDIKEQMEANTASDFLRSHYAANKDAAWKRAREAAYKYSTRDSEPEEMTPTELTAILKREKKWRIADGARGTGAPGRDERYTESEPSVAQPSGEGQYGEEFGYATRLAESLWQKYYQHVSPAWKPLDTLLGVLTQIDNMTTGLTAKADYEALERQVAELNEQITEVPQIMRKLAAAKAQIAELRCAAAIRKIEG